MAIVKERKEHRKILCTSLHMSTKKKEGVCVGDKHYNLISNVFLFSCCCSSFTWHHMMIIDIHHQPNIIIPNNLMEKLDIIHGNLKILGHMVYVIVLNNVMKHVMVYGVFLVSLVILHGE
jgi:hypothetical protein